MVDTRLDIFPFCELALADQASNTIEIWWSDPREIEEIILKFNSSIMKDNIDHVSQARELIKKITYWRNTWPKNRPDPTKVRGSGRTGWQTQDDLYRGIWEEANLILIFDKEEPNLLKIRFDDLQKKEFPEEKYSTLCRRTLKCKIHFNPHEIKIDQIQSCQIFTPSSLSNFKFTLLTDRQIIPETTPLTIKLFNGYIKNTQTVEENYLIGTECMINGVVSKHPEDYDGTLVTINWNQNQQGFTFALQDLVKDQYIILPELGYAVIYENLNYTYESIIKSLQGKTILQRVKESKSRRLNEALEEFKEKKKFYAVIGCEGVRAKGAVTPEGFLSVASQFIRKVPQSDTPRLYWHKEYSQWQFLWSIDQNEISNIPKWLTQPLNRRYEDNLPIFTTTWQEGDKKIEINQEIFATLIEGTQVGVQPEGDSITVAMMCHKIKNKDNIAHEIHLKIRIGELPTLFPDSVVLDSLFSKVDFHKKLEQSGKLQFELIWSDHTNEIKSKNYAQTIEAFLSIIKNESKFDSVLSNENGILSIKFQIAAKQEFGLDWKIPFLHIDDMSKLTQLDYSNEIKTVRNYWLNRIKDHTKISLLEPELAFFYEKHLWHMLLTNDREVGSDRLVGRVGSMGYGCYANEVCMMTMDLDRRGRFDESRRMLETFIRYQGTVGLDGAYEDMDGIYFGANGYEMGVGYNQNQGFVLWAIAEHTLLSHDYRWFGNQIPSIIKACDWIISERKSFSENLARQENLRWNICPNKGEFLGTGLLPPGGVEDLTDYWYWLSTNAYNFYGLEIIAKLLKIIQHPEEKRIREAANDYKEAILRNVSIARLRNPVVKLRNGTYVPHFPCHVHRRGRGYGWIQEVLEGGIHLIRTGLIPIHSQEATWIIEDLEDNCYLSQEFGYPVTEDEFQQYWFTRGGFSMQPFLLCNHMIFAMRNDFKPFIRAVYNSFAVNYREDTKLFTEHPLPTMFDWFGHSFKTSDEANCCSCLRTMYCLETASKDEFPLNKKEEYEFPDTLRLLSGIPDYWFEKSSSIIANDLPTYFGTIKQLSCNNTQFELQLIRNFNTFEINLEYIIIYLRHSMLKFTQLEMLKGQCQIYSMDLEKIILKVDLESQTGDIELILKP